MNRFLFALFRPFKSFKALALPKTFFARALLIVIVPVVCIQLISGYVFFDRHWDYVTRIIAQNIAGDLFVMTEAFMEAQTPDEEQAVFRRSHTYLQIKMNKVAGRLNEFPTSDRSFQSVLEDQLQEKLPYPYHLRMSARYIRVWVETPKGILAFQTNTKRLFSRTTFLFLLWSIGASVLFLILAALFMRNQIRPLGRLVRLADQIGRGQLTYSYTPEGALEFRKVGSAFQLMSERLCAYVQERTETLAGISHDLRTPLTRMKLQLALMDESTEVKNLQEEVDLMIHLVEGYLDFMQGYGEGVEPTEEFSLRQAVLKTLKHFPHLPFEIDVDIIPSLRLHTRARAFGRCLQNIIENACRYAYSKACVSAVQEAGETALMIDDDGPGIPESEREKVLKPFVRVDTSRNAETGGSGLGLAIVKNLMQAQGGRIELLSSPLGGLRVVLYFKDHHSLEQK